MSYNYRWRYTHKVNSKQYKIIAKSLLMRIFGLSSSQYTYYYNKTDKSLTKDERYVQLAQMMAHRLQSKNPKKVLDTIVLENIEQIRRKIKE